MRPIITVLFVFCASVLTSPICAFAGEQTTTEQTAEETRAERKEARKREREKKKKGIGWDSELGTYVDEPDGVPFDDFLGDLETQSAEELSASTSDDDIELRRDHAYEDLVGEFRPPVVDPKRILKPPVDEKPAKERTKKEKPETSPKPVRESRGRPTVEVEEGVIGEVFAGYGCHVGTGFLARIDGRDVAIQGTAFCGPLVGARLGPGPWFTPGEGVSQAFLFNVSGGPTSDAISFESPADAWQDRHGDQAFADAQLLIYRGNRIVISPMMGVYFFSIRSTPFGLAQSLGMTVGVDVRLQAVNPQRMQRPLTARVFFTGGGIRYPEADFTDPPQSDAPPPHLGFQISTALGARDL